MENDNNNLDPNESTQEEIQKEDKEQDIAKLQQERDEYLAGWQRARADFLNYRKEEIERLGELFRHANEEFVAKLLPVLDNLERAEKEASEEEKNSLVVQGCLLAISQLRDFLKKQGVEAMKVEGEKFNPEFHEALGVKEGGESGLVAEELEKGYTIYGKLLRPAKVKIFQ
ncbi:MAG: nucleotide exchange factor GrpE [bacterium]|nr:nucleotide exchange factor GrpE [bacterium]